MTEPPAHFERLLRSPNRKEHLEDLIDAELLVNRHLLRSHGIDPAGIAVEYDPTFFGGATFGPPDYTIIVGPEVFGILERNPEHAYVFFAHELTHMIHSEEEGYPEDEGLVTASGRPTKYHSRDVREQEAIFWEAQQAARFGWSREEYEAFIVEIHSALSYPESMQRGIAVEMRERAYAALPVMSRRPPEKRPHASGLSDREVRVRQHRRRA